VLVVQNDVGNRFSPTVVVLALTSQIDKARCSTTCWFRVRGLPASVVLAEQMRTLDKRRLRERIGMLPPEAMEKVNRAIRISLAVEL
jgi:mRNA interferase MazF